jgi:hypothetical protein
MPLYRCNACGYVAEESITPVGKSMPCNRCAQPVTVFGTVFYVEKLLERYTDIRRELQALRALEAPQATPAPSSPPASVTICLLTSSPGTRTCGGSSKNTTAGGNAPAARASLGCVRFVHFHKDDTDTNLATVAQHAPLQNWFQARQIQVDALMWRRSIPQVTLTKRHALLANVTICLVN